MYRLLGRALVAAAISLVAGSASQALGQANIPVNDPALDLIGEHTTQSETALAVDGATVCAGYINTRLGAFPNPLAGFSRSINGGLTWSDLGIAHPLQGSDPVLAVHRASGRFHYASIAGVGGGGPSETLKSIIGVSRSTDGCQSFSTLANASPSVAGASASVCAPGPLTFCTQNSQCASGQVCTTASLQDKPWIAVDNSGGPRDGHVYVCWTAIPSGVTRFSRSVDGGFTFIDEQSLPGMPGVGCQVAVGPVGEVYVSAAADNVGGVPIRFLRSVDGGQSWGPVVQVNSSPNRVPGTDRARICGGSPRPTLNGDIRMIVGATMAVDTTGGPHDGNIYVAWASDPSGGTDNSDVWFSRSTDGGSMWSPRMQIAGGTATDQFMPTLAVGGSGAVSIAWYDRRLDPANLAIDVYRAISIDGGATFGAIQRVTSQSFSVPPINNQPTSSGNFDSARSACYMGDYIASAGDDGSFYYVWGDNRMSMVTPAYPGGRPDPDVFFARFPIPGSTVASGRVSIDINDLGVPAPSYTGLLTFDDRTFTPFGVNVNLGQSVGAMSVFNAFLTSFTANPPPALGGFGSFQQQARSTPTTTRLFFAANGSFVCQPAGCNSGLDVSFISNLSSVSGTVGSSLLSSLGPNVVLTGDGATGLVFSIPELPSCALGASSGHRCFTGRFGINAFRGAVTPVSIPVGTPVTVHASTTFYNSLTGTEVPVDVEITYQGGVVGTGITTVTGTSSAAGSIGSNFAAQVGTCSGTTLSCTTNAECPAPKTCTLFRPAFFDASTTASFVGPVTVCNHYPDNEPSPPGGDGLVDGTQIPESSLRILHATAGVFSDVTLPGYPDALNNVVCGQVASLSPFVLATRAIIPGGAGRYECSSEWAVGPTIAYGRRGRILTRVECADGGGCDLGTTVGECTFSIAACPNQADMRIPHCTPSAIARYNLKKPLTSASDTIDAINAVAIRTRLAALAPGAVGPNDVTFATPLSSSACTTPIAIRVPLKNGKKGTRVVKVEAVRPDGKKDSDSLTLVCRPWAPGDG